MPAFGGTSRVCSLQPCMQTRQYRMHACIHPPCFMLHDKCYSSDVIRLVLLHLTSLQMKLLMAMQQRSEYWHDWAA